ncbi:MAG: ABC transporter substrate-binding protein [Thermodesulfobacteriota bacterium]
MTPLTGKSGGLGHWKGLALAALLACWLPTVAAWAADRIVIGVPTSLTLAEGSESRDAVILAAEEINARGGVRVGGQRMKIEVVETDLRDGLPGVDPGAAVAGLETFLREKKPQALLVGPFRSEVLLAGLDVIAAHRRPLIGTIAMSPATELKVLKDPRHRFVFRAGLDAKYLVGYLIHSLDFLREKFGFGRVYIMNQDVAWARSTASMTMRLYFNRQGWKVLGQENYPSATADFTAGLARARTEKAQVILCVFDDPHSGRLVEQWNQMQVPAILAGFISPMTGPSAWEKFDRRIARALSMVFELGNLPSRRHPPATAFYEAYRRRFGREIETGHGPAPSYEGVHLLAEAATRAGSLDPDRLVTALEQTDRLGTMGRIRFHKGHQAVFGSDPGQEALACLVQWTGSGERRIVFPQAVAEGELELPPFVPSVK